MADDSGLLHFSQQLRAEVLARATVDAEDGQAEFRENVFTTLVAEYLAEAGVIDDAEVCFFCRRTGKGIVKINAFAVDEETRQLDLFVTTYSHSESPSRLAKSEVTRTIEQLVRFYRVATNGLHKEMEEAYEVYGMVERIFELRAEIERIRCFFLTDGLSPLSSLPETEISGVHIRFEVWDIERLFRVSLAQSPHESVTIDFRKRFGSPLRCLSIPQDLQDYTAYVAMIPGPMLSELYDEFGSRLLELNVRSFLQAKGKVNRGIRDTLKNQPERFLAYNNGISATAEHVELVHEGGISGIALIRDLQIVNGGQTTASIHRAAKEDKADLSNVFVQAKITVVSPSRMQEIVPLISRYANSQNAVREADFSANDVYHIEIERLSETTWCPGEQSRWFYERARGQYQVAKAKEASTPARKRQFEAKCPTSQKFSKTDLAKFINSWDLLPNVVSRGAQKNFVEFMLRVQKHPKEWSPDTEYYKELIAKAILFLKTQKVIRQLKIPAYGANVVCYTVAYLAHRCAGRLDLKTIWGTQNISAGIEETLRKWAPLIYEAIVEGAKGRNVTEWAKKEECWNQVRSLSLHIPAALQVELSAIQPQSMVGEKTRNATNRLSAADEESIARVMQIPAATWFEISDWGRRSGKLKAWQSGIAHTLSGYASDGWERVPSLKQAAQALKILEIASQDFDAFT
ncbi:AIPR family protein [Bremerella cremea]|uniref:AIPR family protein n=1 Tax=Bremerella cremea TaxID=1031537 RepID=UPI0031EE94EF